MRFREIVRFELGHQRRQLTTWFYLLLLFAVPLLLMAGGANPVGTGDLLNAPLKITIFMLFIGLLGTLVTAGLFVEAGHRDLRWRMNPLVQTLPLRPWEALGGRFTGALLVNSLLLLAIPVALALGMRLPDVTSEMLGPFRLQSYLVPYVLIVLPNMLITATVLFGLTVLSRRSLAGYLGGLGLLAIYLLSVNEVVGPEVSWLWALAEPTGAVALGMITEDWTRVDLDTRLVEVERLLLWNRLIWMALGAALFAVTCRRFRFAYPQSRPRLRRSAVVESSAASSPNAELERGVLVVPTTNRSFGIPTRIRQCLAVVALGFRQVLLGRDFFLIATGLFLFAVFVGTETMTDSMFGMPLWPLTQEVATHLSGRVVTILIGLLTIFYAGELVWSGRETGIDTIGDTAPVPDWVPVMGKFLALALMLFVLQSLLMGAGMLSQALQGYTTFRPGLYLRILFGFQLPDYLLFAMLAMVVHVVVNQKYVGHVVAALLYFTMLQPRRFGLEHNLLVYGSDAGWVYSDLNGFGPSLQPFLWFKLYWSGWALLLGLIAMLLWIRGPELGLRDRMRLARQRFTPRVAGTTAAALVLVAATAGVIFYNTNILNEYLTGWKREAVHAEYERRYKRFEHTPQPWLAGMRLHVEIDPERREVAVRASYRLVNRTDESIRSVHISSYPHPSITSGAFRFDRAAKPTLEDAAHGYRIFTLTEPLPPGESLQMEFEIDVALRGFRNRERPTLNDVIIGDFTHLSSGLLLPAIGYQRELNELSNPATRAGHDLPSAHRSSSIEDRRAHHVPRGFANADWIEFEATVGTAAGHTAVLPGTLVRTWSDSGRRYFHYRAETPIPVFFGLLSADYATHEAEWTPPAGSGSPVKIIVLHHPGHVLNLEQMVRNAQASLEYMTEEFGRYPHRQFRMIEFPRYGNFARAYPGQLVYSENHPIHLARASEELRVDGTLLVTAHELAHQWWGKQIIGADVPGASVLTESLAQYVAVMVLERTRGTGAARGFLRNMHMAYLDSRASHSTPEVPLLITTDHEYIHYRKGAIVMYTLQDYIGEERVNDALRRMLLRHGMQSPPYPTSLDLYRELQAVTPDSLQHLLEDLFATMTLWDLETTGARAEPAGNGDYLVTLQIEAAKMRANGDGDDVEIPMNDPVDIAVFGEEGEALYLRKHPIVSGTQSITVSVSARPARAGVDPYHKLITRRLEGLIDAKVREVRISR